MLQKQKNCSQCGGPRDRNGQAYCKKCHAEWMREHRVPYRNLAVVGAKRPAVARHNGLSEEENLSAALKDPENSFWTKRAIQKRLEKIKGPAHC